ncbi:hypothetical protein HK098_003912 [Nowakowskiella sp. JEL0407]|nr:hypothetical protein HK098_003912 [Nowakowskiella sp. JEL0407]
MQEEIKTIDQSLLQPDNTLSQKLFETDEKAIAQHNEIMALLAEKKISLKTQVHSLIYTLKATISVNSAKLCEDIDIGLNEISMMEQRQASNNRDTIGRLVEAGMDILRINLSHTTHEIASQIIADLNDYIAESKIAAEVGVWIDINGPKVRTGKLSEGKDVWVKQGDDFFFVNDVSLVGDNTKIATTYTKELVNIGDKVFVDDGAMSFTVVERLEDSIRTEADHSGLKEIFSVHPSTLTCFFSLQGINFPSHVIEELPALSDKDKKDLNFALDLGVDFISLSCIRNIEDVEEARYIQQHILDANINLLKFIRLMLGNSKSKLLAKIENERSMQNFDSILRLADGIVIDRGYLGAEVDIEVVTMNQKKMIALANIAGKPILVASQMLESMRTSPRPTRSEAADIANTVMDGVDGLVLSAETAVGRFPVESVETMRRIAVSAEQNFNYYEYQLKMMRSIPKPVGVSESIASSAVTMARQVNASIIICATELGGTARLVAKYRPQIPVLAATCIKQTARQLNICFGLRMYHHKDPINTVVDGTLRYAVEIGLAKPGDIAVVTSGQVVGFLEGVTTKMQVVTVPEFTD